MRKFKLNSLSRNIAAGLVICFGLFVAQNATAQNTFQKGNTASDFGTDQAMAQEVNDLDITADLNTVITYARTKISEILNGTVSYGRTEQEVRMYFYQSITRNENKVVSGSQLVKESLLKAYIANESYRGGIDMEPFLTEVETDL